MGIKKNTVYNIWILIEIGLSFLIIGTLATQNVSAVNYADNFRTAYRVAIPLATTIPVPYLATWIKQVSRSGNPVTPTQIFVVRAIPTALKMEKKYGVKAAFFLGQAIYESDRGRSRLAVEGHNYFGVKYQGRGTPIFIDGIAYQRFMNMEASFDQQGHLLTDPDHAYVSALKYKNNVFKYAREVQRLGYCSNRNYAAMIREIVNDFALEIK